MTSPPSATPGRVPFVEAIDYFRAKLNVPTQAWTDLWQDQHAVGFMVAGAATADLVQDFRAAIDKAISSGTTLQEFRRDFDAIVARHGWSYRGSREWRTKTIFETNLRTSYQVGRWEQAWSARKDRPYLLYVAVLDRRTRDLHRQWNGTILPITDEWWRTHYPPNGWGCRCMAQSLSERDLTRRGMSVSPRPSSPPRWVEVRGQGRIEVPAGIDPGWGYNVGIAAQRAAAARLAASKLGQYEPDLAAVVARSFSTETRRALADDFRGWAQQVAAGAVAQSQYRVIGALAPEAVAALADRQLLQQSAAVAIDAQQLGELQRLARVWPKQSVASDELLRLVDLVAVPEAVLVDLRHDPPRVLLVLMPSDPEAARTSRIVVELAAETRPGGQAALRLNTIRSAWVAPIDTLTDPEAYDVVTGRVG